MNTSDAERVERLIVKLLSELRYWVPDRADSMLPELDMEARALDIDPFDKRYCE